MRFNKIYSTLGLMLVLAGCAAEAPFPDDREKPDAMGEFRKSSLDLDVISGESINVITRAQDENIDINDFKLTFVKDGTRVKEVNYGDMPDVVMLDPGVYRISAVYGEDKDAAFSSPYFEGMSGEFSVTANSIVTDIDPIKCVLKNVMVTIVFDEELKNSIADDGYIEVKLGNNGPGLQFYKDETRAGYFRKGSATTLIAVFHGAINGAEVTETKSMSDITIGSHYEVTFKLHNHNGANHGGTTGTVTVDASVNYENIENNVVVKDLILTDESERPKQDDDEPGNDDNQGDTPSEGGPEITAQDPVKLDDWNIATEDLKCVLNVHSESGITGFTVKINSATLTEEILTGVGLASEFDLITGKTAAGVDVMDGLSGLGLPVADQVVNQKDVVFDVSQFMGLLGIYGAADHKFILTVTDASGTIVKELKLRTL